MKCNKRPFPLATVRHAKPRINTNPDFQRPPVWSRAQKQLLIDSILREYDVPKMYWLETTSKPKAAYDVVDGQQRLRAIWEFYEGGFPLPKDADDVDGEAVAGCRFADLPDDIQAKFDVYTLDVVVLEDTDEDEVRDMFLRLQNGTSLKAQEKRNAYPGKMRDFVRQTSQHPFFSKVKFANSRFTHDHVAAQMVCLELAGQPTNIKDADLNKMYRDNQGFDPSSKEGKAVDRVLSILDDVFPGPGTTPELERFSTISLYCVVAELLKQYVIDDVKPHLYHWFLAFEVERRAQESLPSDQIDSEWLTYKTNISHSTDAEDSVKWRMEFMMRKLLAAYPDIRLKDAQRGFTHLQRLTIFRRDGGICQLKINCKGDKLTWDGWHCDHKVPHTKGGLTTVDNGEVACPACNLSKGSKSPDLLSKI